MQKTNRRLMLNQYSGFHIVGYARDRDGWDEKAGGRGEGHRPWVPTNNILKARGDLALAQFLARRSSASDIQPSTSDSVTPATKSIVRQQR